MKEIKQALTNLKEEEYLKNIIMTRNIKRIKNIVLNQNKSRFALIWENCKQKVVIDNTIHKFDYESALKFYKADQEPYSGFTIFDSQTLKEIVDFTPVSMTEKYQMKLIHQSFETKYVSLLYCTGLVAIVFAERPQQVEFYELDQLA